MKESYHFCYRLHAAGCVYLGFKPDLSECDCIAASKEWCTETDHLDPAYMCVLGDGGGDSDRGCIAFDTQTILLDSECISAITLPECLPAIET